MNPSMKPDPMASLRGLAATLKARAAAAFTADQDEEASQLRAAAARVDALRVDLEPLFPPPAVQHR